MSIRYRRPNGFKASAAAVPTRETVMERKQTIFYVDDNPKSQRLLTAILQDFGFEVVTASCPMKALELINDISFDLVLLDYQMPKMTGAQLAQAIKDILPGTPVVMISGFATVPTEDLVYVDAYQGKGVTLQELLETIRMLLLSAIPGSAGRMHPGSIERTGKSHLWTGST
jgi:CheY-like chemotaxis protein